VKKVVSTILLANLALNPMGHSTSQLSQAWGLKGQYGVNVLAADKLMSQKCENSQVVVAVIDTGLDISHSSIKNSLWINKLEKNGRPGVDDDRNGFIDDIHGWDFVTRSGKIIDKHGHGTHIAGIIAAKPTAEDDFRGLCPGVQIMSLRYYDPSAAGEENLDYTIKGVEYAIQNGATIINYSGGGNSFSDKEFKAIKKAQEKGILVVAAAGNESNPSDQKPYYPASYSQLDNIISVGAINDQGLKLPRSNFGVKNVHIAAPGQSILSTLPGGSFGYLTGTSQATAFVSGIAAQLLVEGGSQLGVSLAQRTQLVKKIILGSGTKSDNLKGLVSTSAYSTSVAALENLKSMFGNASKTLTVVESPSVDTSRKKMQTPLRKVSDESQDVSGAYLMQLEVNPFSNKQEKTVRKRAKVIKR
jgi:thermitase